MTKEEFQKLVEPIIRQHQSDLETLLEYLEEKLCQDEDALEDIEL